MKRSSPHWCSQTCTENTGSIPRSCDRLLNTPLRPPECEPTTPRCSPSPSGETSSRTIFSTSAVRPSAEPTSSEPVIWPNSPNPSSLVLLLWNPLTNTSLCRRLLCCDRRCSTRRPNSRPPLSRNESSTSRKNSRSGSRSRPSCIPAWVSTGPLTISTRCVSSHLICPRTTNLYSIYLFIALE